MTTIGVTGATGRLGRVIVAQLKEGGADDIVALVRTPSKAADLGVEARRWDFDDPESMNASAAGVDTLLLMPTKAPALQRAGQLQGGIDAAVAGGVEHIVFSGIVGTHPETRTAINPALLYTESALRVAGPRWTVLRNGLYTDEIVAWWRHLVKLGTVPYPTGDGRTAFVSRRDIAAATAAVLLGRGERDRVYELTGPQLLSTEDLCGILAEVTGEDVRFTDATDADYVAANAGSTMPPFILKILLGLYGAIREGRMAAYSDHIERLTGTRPATFRELLQAEVRGS